VNHEDAPVPSSGATGQARDAKKEFVSGLEKLKEVEPQIEPRRRKGREDGDVLNREGARDAKMVML